MSSTSKPIIFRIEAAVVGLMDKIIPLLPRPAMLAMARGLGSLAYLFDRRGRETGLQNLRAAMAAGHLPQSDPEAILKRSYELFARSTCELFWAARLDVDNYSRYIQIDCEDRAGFDRAIEEGAIWVTPHYGNFEWISLVMALRGQPFTLVAQDFKNPKLTEIFTRLREQHGHTVIPTRRAPLRLLKALKSGGHVAMLTDLTVNPDKSAVPIHCFSFTTCVTGLHAFLQDRTGAKLIPGISIPCHDGTYLMKTAGPIEIPDGASLTEISQRCWDAFEPMIRDFPEPWLWMYKHWRYRPQGDTADSYPDYANHSKKFDRWLQDSTAD